MTLGQTTTIILTDSINTDGTNSIREILEVRNHKQAFNRLMREAADQTPINIDLLRKFHQDLTYGTVYNAGSFKESENLIRGASFQTAPPAQVPMLMKQWCDNLNYQLAHTKNNDEFLRLLLENHLLFERYHPFSDGNGRTGRLLINYELVKRDMPLLVIERKDRASYLRFLVEEDIAVFLRYTNKLKEEQKRRSIFLVNEQK